MGNADTAESVAGHEGLDVFQHGLTGGGVSYMADCVVSRELVEFGFIEDFRNKPDAGDGFEDTVGCGDDDAGSFLATVLECVEG